MIPAATLPGDYFILAVSDNSNKITETNENNNVAFEALKVIDRGPNLFIQQAQVNDSVSIVGKHFNIKCSFF
jgi:subtilase family serine protease